MLFDQKYNLVSAGFDKMVSSCLFPLYEILNMSMVLWFTTKSIQRGFFSQVSFSKPIVVEKKESIEIMFDLFYGLPVIKRETQYLVLKKV